MVDKIKLRQKIQFIRDNVKMLKSLQKSSLDDFTKSDLEIAASIRFLQVAIEAMIDIAAHISAKEGLGIPKKYRDSFELLAKNNIIDKDKLNTYINMVKFRNRAVHIYDEIDNEEIFNIINNNLEDFESFIQSIVSKYF